MSKNALPPKLVAYMADEIRKAAKADTGASPARPRAAHGRLIRSVADARAESRFRPGPRSRSGPPGWPDPPGGEPAPRLQGQFAHGEPADGAGHLRSPHRRVDLGHRRIDAARLPRPRRAHMAVQASTTTPSATGRRRAFAFIGAAALRYLDAEGGE